MRTAKEAMEAYSNSRKRVRTDATMFLRARLAGGPVLAKTIEEEAEDLGITRAMLRTAQNKLHVHAEKLKGTIGGGWWWSLPGAVGWQDDLPI